MAYNDMREYLETLERNGLLCRVKKEVDKDWELSAVCRLTFTQIPPEKRPALMFERVKGFDIPVVAGIIGGSRKIYATALGLPTTANLLEAIAQKWSTAIKNPIAPKVVDRGPCKENILKGDEVNLLKLPVPVWTVGEDPGPYLTSPFVISKDPETGIQNMGTYRVQVKGRNRTGLYIGKTRHMYRHILKNDEMNRPTEVAIVIGADPTVAMTSVASVPYGLDELAVTGGLRGCPLEVVKCETVDLLVPATAEIVIEGMIQPHAREMEGPFGEYTGYMGPPGLAPYIEVTCITHRNNPIYQAFVSQMPPSESSLIRSIGRESSIYTHLKYDHRMPIRDVRLKEAGGAASYLVISMKPQFPGQVWEAAWAAWTLDPSFGKFTVVVDDDIDIRDDFAVDWALSFRVQPQKDIQIIGNTAAVHLDPSVAPRDVLQSDPSRNIASKVFIDATRKHEYPHIALPPKEHLDVVWARWSEYGVDR